MIRYIVKRLLYGFLVIYGVVTIVFFLFTILPGDPARMMMGQRADISSVENIKKDLGLDKPVFTQYLNYLNDLSPISVHNTNDSSDFWYLDKSKYSSAVELFSISNEKVLVLKPPYLRRSYQSKREVSEILTEAFPKTALLAVVSILFAIIIGILLGIISAVKKDSVFDKAALVFAVMGMSVPSFFAAIIIAWFFAYVMADSTGLNMVGSMYTIDDFGEGEFLSLKNLILPALTLGIRPLAIVIQLTRNSLLDVMSQDYIRTARAKGLNERKIILKHALRNALNPVVTAITGWFASLLAGAVFVEYVFDWKGIGVVIVDSLEKYDFPVLMGALLSISIILVLINILVDIFYAYIDPRVKLQ